MKPPSFEYLRPGSVEEAVQLLGERGDDAKVVAGGQSLVPLLSLRLSYPEVLIDVSRIAALRGCVADEERVQLGATVTHAMVEDALVPDPTGGLLPRVAAGIGYRAIRSRGTVAGSLAHADPSAEWPVVLAALDARVRARSASGQRDIAVRELFEGHFVTTLAPDELIVGVDVPRIPPTTVCGFHKQARKAGEFADSLAVAVVTRENGQVTAADVWLGAAGGVPLPLPAAAETLVAEGWSRRARDKVRDDVRQSLGAAHDDETRYARQLHAVTVSRALEDALGVAT